MRQYNSGQPQGQRKFWAFISYARADEPWAAWLHRRLERYRIPKDLLANPIEEGLRIDRLAPIFRDLDELAASPDLDASLKAELDASAFLILVCSPSAARSQWVNAEASYFLERGRSKKIIYLVVDGEPLAERRGFDPKIECLPPAIAGAIAAGRLAQPGWADVRRRKGGRRHAFAGVVASLIGAGIDVVIQREKRRTLRRFGLIATGATMTAAAFAITIYLLNSAAEQRVLKQKAEAQQRELTQQAETQKRELAQRAEALQRELAQKAAKAVEAARAEKTAGRMQSALGMLVTQAREMQQNKQPVPPDLRRLLLETLFVTPSIDARRVKVAAPASGSPGPEELPDLITSLQYRHSRDGKLVGWLVDHSLQTAKPQRAAVTISAVNVDTGRLYSRDLPIDISKWSLSGEANLLVTCHNSNGTCVVRRLEDAANGVADTFSSADVSPAFLSIDAKLGQVYVAGTRSRKTTKEHVIVLRDFVRGRTVREVTFPSDDPLDNVQFFETFPERDRMVAVTYERIYELKLSSGEVMRTGLVRRGLLAEVRLQSRGIVVRMAYDIDTSRLAVSSAARGTEVITFRGDGKRLEETAAVTLGAAPGSAGVTPLSPQSVSGMVFLNGGRDLFISGANPRFVSLPEGPERKANEAGFSIGRGVIMAWRDPASGLLMALDRQWNLSTLRRRSALELARNKLDVAYAYVHQIIPFGDTDLAFYGEMRWLLVDRNSLELKINEDLVMGSHHRVGQAFDPDTRRALMGSHYDKSPLIELASDGRSKQRIEIDRPHQFAMFKSASLTDDGSRVAVLWETSAAFERSQGRVRNPLEPYEGGFFLSVYDAKDGRLIRGRPFETRALALFPLKRGGFAVIVSRDGDHMEPGRVSYFSGDGEEKTSETIQPDDKLWLITTPVGDSVIISDQSGRAAYAFDLEAKQLKKLDLDSLKSSAGGFGCSLDVAAASPGRLLVAPIASRNAFRWSTCLLRSSADLSFEVLAIAPLAISGRAVFAFLSERQLLSYDDDTGDLVTWGLPADDAELLAAAEDVLRSAQGAERARVN
jgi:hypothetical protein